VGSNKNPRTQTTSDGRGQPRRDEEQLDLFRAPDEVIDATSKLVGTKRKSAVSAKRAHNGVMSQRFLS
jgi:hypothetical protein